MRYHMLTAEIIQSAGRKARQFGHSYVGSAHILGAICEQRGPAGQLLDDMLSIIDLAYAVMMEMK